MKKSHHFEYYFAAMGLMVALNVVGGTPNEHEAKNTDLSSATNTSYNIYGETYSFDPNQLTAVLEVKRYSFRATNDQIHVVDVITDKFGTSTKAYRIDTVQTAQKNPAVALTPSANQNFGPQTINSRVDATSAKTINYQIGSWLSHGFTGAFPPQNQFQPFFMPSTIPSNSIVVPFAVVFNPFTGNPSAPDLFNHSDKPELINSIFQVPAATTDENNQPPIYTSTPSPAPPQLSISTPNPPTSSTPYYNYFGTSSAPSRPSYLPPTESAVNSIDIRHFKFASTATKPLLFNNRFSIDDGVTTESNLSLLKPSTELSPPFED